MAFFKLMCGSGEPSKEIVESQEAHIKFKEDVRNRKSFSTWLTISWNEILKSFTANPDTILQNALLINQENKTKGIFNDTLKFTRLQQVSDTNTVFEVNKPFRPDPDLRNIIFDEKIQMLWLDTPSNRTTFGGPRFNHAINIYQGPTFKDGYCYLNMVYTACSRLYASNHDSYGDFVQDCPIQLGPYPTFTTVAQLALYMISQFPEVCDADIPCFYISPDLDLIHVGDRRNRPSGWAVLKICTLSDLAQTLRDTNYEILANTPVGSTQPTHHIENLTKEEQYLNPTLLASWNKILVDKTTGGYNAFSGMLTTSEATVVGKFSNTKILNTSLNDLILDNVFDDLNNVTPLENPNHKICVDETIPKVWLDMPTLSSTFGGPSLTEPLYSFLGTQFLDGFCYLNIFIDLGFHIRRCHTIHLANFIEVLPNVLGSYPALGQISQAVQYLVARCPELLPCSIPLIYYSSVHNMLHVADKRGRPAGWQILKIFTIADLIAVQGNVDMHEIMPLPTGASTSNTDFTQTPITQQQTKGLYTNWKPVHNKLGPWVNAKPILEMFDDFRKSGRKSTTAYNALQRDSRNLQEVRCVGQRQRFDADESDNDYVCVVDMGNQYLRRMINQIPQICHNILKLDRIPKRQCYERMCKHIDEIELFIFDPHGPQFVNRAVFESEHKLTWNNQWWEVKHMEIIADTYKKNVMALYTQCKQQNKSFLENFVYDSTRFLHILHIDKLAIEQPHGDELDKFFMDLSLSEEDEDIDLESEEYPQRNPEHVEAETAQRRKHQEALSSQTAQAVAQQGRHLLSVPEETQLPDLPSNVPVQETAVERYHEPASVPQDRPSKTMHTFVILMTVFSVLTTVFKFIPRDKALAMIQSLKRFLNRFRRPTFSFFRRPPPDDDFPSNYPGSGPGPNPPPPPSGGPGPRQDSSDSYYLPTPTSDDDLLGTYSYNVDQPPPTVIQINDAVLNALFTENFTDLLANAYSWQRTILRYVTASDLTNETPIAAIYRLLNAVSAIQEEMNDSGLMAEGALSIVARAEARLNPEHPGVSLAEHLHTLQQDQLQISLRNPYILSLSATGETLVNIIKNEIEPILNRPNAEFGTPIHRQTYVLMRRYVQILLEADVGEEHILEHIAEGRNHVEQLNTIYEINQPSLILRNLQQIAELRSASAEDALRLGVELQSREIDARHREEIQRLSALNDITRDRQAQIAEEENERARQKHELEMQIAKKALEMEEEQQQTKLLQEANEREREQHRLNLEKVSLEMETMRSTEARERYSRPIETGASVASAVGMFGFGVNSLRNSASASPASISRSRSRTRVASSSPLGLRHSLATTSGSTTAHNFGPRVGVTPGTRRFLTGRGHRLR